jgi:hypothetical protein
MELVSDGFKGGEWKCAIVTAGSAIKRAGVNSTEENAATAAAGDIWECSALLLTYGWALCCFGDLQQD